MCLLIFFWWGFAPKKIIRCSYIFLVGFCSHKNDKKMCFFLYFFWWGFAPKRNKKIFVLIIYYPPADEDNTAFFFWF